MELFGWCLLVLKSTRMILEVVCKYIVDGRGVRIPDQTRSAKRQRDTATWHNGFHHRIVHIHLTWKRPLQNNLVSAKGKYRNLLSWLIRNYGVQWKDLLVVSAVPNYLPSTMNPNHYCKGWWFHCEKCRCWRHPQSKNIGNTDGFCLLACRERGKATHLIPAYLPSQKWLVHKAYHIPLRSLSGVIGFLPKRESFNELRSLKGSFNLSPL